ncbi:MAG: fibronectin type III domain-containing protein [Spirochaetaceae bacterium]|jgi:hypothetical protein|nr:fibronectin type III domain-containing protein [Spirochaetaceae bacterium]
MKLLNTKNKITALALTALAVSVFFASCENETAPEDDPNIVVPPGPLSVTAGESQLNVRWTKVVGAIDYKVYVATAEEGTREEWTTDAVSINDTNLIQITLTGLANGKPYYIWAKAVYSIGISDYSEKPAVGTPLRRPEIPTGLALEAGDTMLTASWDAPNEGIGGPVYSYELAYSTNAAFDPETAPDRVEVGASTLRTFITGLDNNSLYYVRLRAKNTGSGSAFTAAQNLAPVYPGDPQAPPPIIVTPGNKRLSIRWQTAANASSYAVYKNTVDNAATAALVVQNLAPKLGSNPEGDNTYSVTGFANGALGYVWVVARNSQNLGNDAASATATAGSGTPAPKSEPVYTNNNTIYGKAVSRFVNEESGHGDRLARKKETALGNLTGDALVWWAREHYPQYTFDFAFYNGGLIVAGIDGGDITTTASNITGTKLKNAYYGGGGDAFSIIVLSGAKVIELYQYAASIRHDGGGGSGTGAFGQSSAEVRYTINYTYGTDPRFGTLENLTIGGAGVDPNREYRIITSSYLCDGGDGYGAYLYSDRRQDTGVQAWRMVAEYIYDHDLPLDPPDFLDGRLKLIGEVWSRAQ